MSVKSGQLHSADELAAYEMLEIRAYVAVPVLRVGQIVAFLAVNHTKPHAWTAVESARAKVSLRASEEKYCALFGQMDEAYAVIELLADAAGHWMDCRFLEVNLAFMWHMGMLYPVGRTAAEMLGTPKPRWAQYHGRVADTGVSIRMQDTEFAHGRVFDAKVSYQIHRAVAVSRCSSRTSRRKQAESDLRAREEQQRYLVKLGNALRPLAESTTIQGETRLVLGEQLGSERAYYVEVDARRVE